MTGLLLFGAEGRMGREVAALAAQYGFTLGEKAEAAIDFSHPDALDAVLDAVLARGIPLVSGTTGYSLAQQQQIHAAAQRVPILRSANFSLGAAVMAPAAGAGGKQSAGWDGALIERHHAGKVDAPSGTAIALAQAMALPREGILSVRGGTVRGLHEAGFYGPEEHLTIVHCAESRAVVCPWCTARRPVEHRPPGRAVRHGGSAGRQINTPLPIFRQGVSSCGWVTDPTGR